MFVEVPETRDKPETRICCKVVDTLLNRQIGPVGSASTVEEVRQVLEEMKQHNLSPAIFVINTFGAKDLLPVLDPLIGKLPVLYLRRRLFAGESGLSSATGLPNTRSARMKSALGMSVPRVNAMWFYGGKNSDATAKQVATAVLRFLEDGDFLHIERGCAAQIAKLEPET